MHRRWLVAAGLALSLAASATLGACGASDPQATKSGSTSSAARSSSAPASSSAVPTSTTSALDPSHAVAPPGPRTTPLLSADILVISPDTISDATIAKVRKAPGVSGVVPISLANISIQDQLLTVVAADPATYRLFTPESSADNQGVWDRVAGGEMAVDPSVAKTMPSDAFAQMGAAADAPKIHIGAFAPQIPHAVTAVVNQKWGAALHMKSDNALLISTTITSPDRVVGPVQKLVPDASVQRLDVVAQLGLDPQAAQAAVVVGSLGQAIGIYRYSVAGDTVTPDAAWVGSHIVTETVPILGAVTCNRALFPQLKAALAEVVARGLAKTIHTYDGCYNPRFIAGTHVLSNHAFGLAIDINASENQRGTVGQMDRGVVQIFEKWGFTWGGVWQYTDPMHFEMNRIVAPK